MSDVLTAALADTALNERVGAYVNESEALYGEAIRADSRWSPPAVAAQRALIGRSVLQTNEMLERFGAVKKRADERRCRAIAGAIAEALGLREHDGRIVGSEARADSYLPGELIERDANPLRVRDQRRAVIESVNSRNIDPGAKLYESNAINYEGAAALYQPGQTQVPSADYGTGTKNRQVHTLVVRTQIDWLAALHGGMSAINVPAEKAEAADRALNQTLEVILVRGLAGTDLQGLFGGQKLQLIQYVSTKDLAADATTLGQIYAEIQKAVQAIQKENAFRGGTFDSVLVGPEFLHQVMRRSNLDSGGGKTGSDLVMSTLVPGGPVGQAFNQVGITNVMSAPSLNQVPGPAGTETTYAGLVTYEGRNRSGLRRVTALATAPVRTAEQLLGTETLWALRTGGLECPDATSAGTALFKVR